MKIRHYTYHRLALVILGTMVHNQAFAILDHPIHLFVQSTREFSSPKDCPLETTSLGSLKYQCKTKATLSNDFPYVFQFKNPDKANVTLKIALKGKCKNSKERKIQVDFTTDQRAPSNKTFQQSASLCLPLHKHQMPSQMKFDSFSYQINIAFSGKDVDINGQNFSYDWLTQKDSAQP